MHGSWGGRLGGLLGQFRSCSICYLPWLAFEQRGRREGHGGVESAVLLREQSKTPPTIPWPRRGVR